MAERARCDAGVSDIFGTLLLVLGVVLLGTALSLLVAQTLRADAPDAAAYALARARAGDTMGALTLQEGDPVPLDDLRLLVARDGGDMQEVAAMTWGTPDPDELRPGDQLRFPIPGAPLADGERLHVQLTRIETNAVIATLSTLVGGEPSRLAGVTLAASLAPDTLAADATSTALLSVVATQEQGALSVASVVADFGHLGASSRHLVALRDDGRSGDATGGDGIWSALVRIPVNTPAGNYTVAVNATLADGVTTGTTSVPLRIDNAVFTGDLSGNFTGNVSGNSSGNFSGSVDGAFAGVNAGRRAGEGTRLSVPSSANATRFDMRNWTMEPLCPFRLNGDAMFIHAVGGTEVWSAYLRFTWSNTTRTNENCAETGMYQLTELRMWTSRAESVYRPTAPINLSTFTLDLLDPFATANWTVTGAAHPLATYARANITQDPYFTISAMRDEITSGGPSSAVSTGIYAVDVAFV